MLIAVAAVVGLIVVGVGAWTFWPRETSEVSEEDLFEQHTEDTRCCTTGDSLVLDAHTMHQRFGALSPTASMACDLDVLIDPDEQEHELACMLEPSGARRLSPPRSPAPPPRETPTS